MKFGVFFIAYVCFLVPPAYAKEPVEEALKVIPVEYLYHYITAEGVATLEQPDGKAWYHVPSEDAFVNLSDWGGYRVNITSSEGYPKHSRDSDAKTLTLIESQKILDKLSISVDDTLFIYDFFQDKVVSLSVRDILPLYAYVSIYSQGELNVEDDYVVGFRLQKGLIFKDFGHFSYVGKTNPFVVGNLEKIIWKKVGNKTFPVETFKNKIPSGFTFDEKKSYQYQSKEFEYFLYFLNYSEQSDEKHRYRGSAYLIQVKSKTKEVVFELFDMPGEGHEPHPLYMEDYQQWTGRLFKGRAPIYFNYPDDSSFGCPSIFYVNNSRERIPILCDNRH